MNLLHRWLSKNIEHFNAPPMKKSTAVRKQLLAPAMTVLFALLSATSVTAAASEAIPFSSDPAVKDQQQAAYDVIHHYETALNKGNTQKIVSLFAADGVAQWNNKRTAATHQQMIDGYDATFKVAQFNTKFAYDAVSIYGSTAVIRTHHQKGAKVLENGKEVLDLNREVFVLNKTNEGWKIVLYMFNTDPVQGEG